MQSRQKKIDHLSRSNRMRSRIRREVEALDRPALVRKLIERKIEEAGVGLKRHRVVYHK